MELMQGGGIMAYEDNRIRSKDGTWAIVVSEDGTGAHFKSTGSVPKKVAEAVLQKENDGMKKTATELRFYARMLVCGA
jgi:hypothetical protein